MTYDKFDLKEIDAYFKALKDSRFDIESLTKEHFKDNIYVTVRLCPHTSINDIVVEIEISSREFYKSLASYTSFYKVARADISDNYNEIYPPYNYIIHLKIQGFTQDKASYKNIEEYLDTLTDKLYSINDLKNLKKDIENGKD